MNHHDFKNVLVHTKYNLDFPPNNNIVRFHLFLILFHKVCGYALLSKCQTDLLIAINILAVRPFNQTFMAKYVHYCYCHDNIMEIM